MAMLSGRHGEAMTGDWKPGMKFYEASFWRSGEEIFSIAAHAVDEADMIVRSRAYFEDYVQRGLTEGTLEGATAEVRLSPHWIDPNA
jgi:hypothetical protein